MRTRKELSFFCFAPLGTSRGAFGPPYWRGKRTAGHVICELAGCGPSKNRAFRKILPGSNGPPAGATEREKRDPRAGGHRGGEKRNRGTGAPTPWFPSRPGWPGRRYAAHLMGHTLSAFLCNAPLLPGGLSPPLESQCPGYEARKVGSPHTAVPRTRAPAEHARHSGERRRTVGHRDGISQAEAFRPGKQNPGGGIPFLAQESSFPPMVAPRLRGFGLRLGGAPSQPRMGRHVAPRAGKRNEAGRM